MTRHRQSLLAALGLLTPGCAQDAQVASDPIEDARASTDGRPTGGSGGAGGGTPDGTLGRRDSGMGGRLGDTFLPADATGAGGRGGADAAAGGRVADASLPPPPDGALGGNPHCVAPVPIQQLARAPEIGTGFVRCENGAVNRISAVDCDDPLPPGPACQAADGQCAADADCLDKPHGRCVLGQFESTSCYCTYGCRTDSDCGPGLACVCGGAGDAWFPAGATCVPADCTTDADCGGLGCGFAAQNNGCGYDYRLTCRTEDDTCVANQDCGDPNDYTACVRWDETGWSCAPGAVCGRPLRIEGVAVVAPFIERSDWVALGRAPDPSALSPRERARVEAHYLALAALEHASVASFAQFALELMAFGAPPLLLTDAARAMMDEVDHARRCFALASAFGTGVSHGPGALPVAGLRPAPDFTALARSVIREACVGELLGAAEADFIAERAGDPAIRAAFEVIARDEHRHAELGWRTLQWILQQPGAPTPLAVSEAFDSALADFTAPSERGEPDELLQQGLLSEATRRGVFAEAARQIIRPCLRALLQGPSESVRAAV